MILAFNYNRNHQSVCLFRNNNFCYNQDTDKIKNMEISSIENQTRKIELRTEKEKNKEILSKLSFLLENDEESGGEFYERRKQEVDDKVQGQIHEIKRLNFDRVVNQFVGCRVLENMLSHVPAASEILVKISNRNAKVRDILKKHNEKYGIDVLRKEAELINENNLQLDEMNESIDIQRKKVVSLQELLLLDSEFSEEYAQLLNQESRQLDEEEYESQIMILDKALELVDNLLLPEVCEKEISALRDKIIEIHQYEVRTELEWEMLPQGVGPAHRSYEKNGEMENNFKALKNYERVQYVLSLNPERIYASKYADKNRNYKAYVFSTCTVLCSEWSDQALYVLPCDNWQELSRNTKDELRFKGAIQLKNVPGWQERLKSIIDGDIVVEIDMDKQRMEKIKLGDDIEDVRDTIRKVIFEKYPQINEAMDRKDFSLANELLKGIKYKDFMDMGLAAAVSRFDNFRNAMVFSFPEAGLIESDFFILNKKFKWKGMPPEEKAANIREAIFSNYPDIEKAIKRGDIKSAREWLVAFTDDDFDAIGLRKITDGKTHDHDFNTRRKALISAFPDIIAEDYFGKKIEYIKYGSVEEKISRWTLRLRKKILEACPEIGKKIEENNSDGAKLLVMKTIKGYGSLYKFAKLHEISSIFGVKELKGKTQEIMKRTFPEIDWGGNFTFRKKIENM